MTAPQIERRLRELAVISERDGWRIARLHVKNFAREVGWSYEAAKAAMNAHIPDICGDWRAVRRHVFTPQTE